MARVSHMVLLVSDIQKSREWYVNRLGFAPEREREEAVGITLTIEVENVDSKHQELASLGVSFVSPRKRQFWGYGAEVLDPDGYMKPLMG